ncbi:hypothetical protein LCGC14_2495630, partial [marine sediment metagenome]
VDATKITGLYVLSQKETPGLGNKIENPEWRGQFVGKDAAVLTAEQIALADETACIRCGRCVDVCPLGLVATKLALASRSRDWEVAKRYYLAACCECGCCAYVCPARIPLVQLMRMGKAIMPRE